MPFSVWKNDISTIFFPIDIIFIKQDKLKNTESSYRDKACKDKGGKCQHNSNRCTSGGYSRGLCDGPSERQCCGAIDGGDPSTCTLVEYTNTHIKGYNGLTIKVDKVKL